MLHRCPYFGVTDAPVSDSSGFQSQSGQPYLHFGAPLLVCIASIAASCCFSRGRLEQVLNTRLTTRPLRPASGTESYPRVKSGLLAEHNTNNYTVHFFITASRCAFAATGDSRQGIIKTSDSPITFPYVHLNTCGGYDAKTGK